jgi:GTPase SAR1 family protein
MKKKFRIINIGIAGPINSGKTTLTNILLNKLYNKTNQYIIRSQIITNVIETYEEIIELRMLDFSKSNLEFFDPTSYINKCNIILYVYDTSDEESFNKLKKMHYSFCDKDFSRLRFILVGNKDDKIKEIPQSSYTKSSINEFCKETLNGATHHIISSITNDGISKLYKDILKPFKKQSNCCIIL